MSQLPFFPQFATLETDTCEYSDVQETRLMLSYTKSAWFTFAFDPNNPPTYGAILLAVLGNTTGISSDGMTLGAIIKVGDADPNQPPGYISPSVCVARRLVVDGPGVFHLVYSFECGSGNTIWEELGNVQAELSNFDKDGTLIQIFYTPPAYGLPLLGQGGNPLGNAVNGLPGGVNFTIPHVPNLPRYISTRLLRRTRILTSPLPNLTVPMYSTNPALASLSLNGGLNRNDFMSYYQGRVNTDDWFGLLPRQALCSRIIYPTQNNYTVTEVCEFMVRDRTWDEVAPYLDSRNHRLPGTSNLPPLYQDDGTLDLSPDGYIFNTEGMKDPVTNQWPSIVNGTGIQDGWVRAKMMPEADFTKDFDPTKDTL